MDEKTRTVYMLSRRHLPQNKRNTQTKIKGAGKIFPANANEKIVGIAMLTSDKIDFKTKARVRDKQRH